MISIQEEKKLSKYWPMVTKLDEVVAVIVDKRQAVLLVLVLARSVDDSICPARHTLISKLV
jgi:hypothetical protein